MYDLSKVKQLLGGSCGSSDEGEDDDVRIGMFVNIYGKATSTADKTHKERGGADKGT